MFILLLTQDRLINTIYSERNVPKNTLGMTPLNSPPIPSCLTMVCITLTMDREASPALAEACISIRATSCEREEGNGEKEWGRE